MSAARKRPTIYRLSDVKPVKRTGRKPLIDDDELRRLRIEIATEVLREVFGEIFDADEMTADDLLRQLADKLRKG